MGANVTEIDFGERYSRKARHEVVEAEISLGFQTLLNGRHLYQHYDVAWEAINAAFNDEESFSEVLRQQAFRALHQQWAHEPPTKASDARLRNPTPFSLPTVETFCEICKKSAAFNPDETFDPTPVSETRPFRGQQVFVFTSLPTLQGFFRNLHGNEERDKNYAFRSQCDGKGTGT